MAIKNDIALHIEGKSDLTKKQALHAIDLALQYIADELAAGNSVEVRGFGTFMIKQRAAKVAQNIAKKEAILVPAKKAPFLKFCQEIKDKVASKPIITQ